eukprot:SAG31_NODE_677_length_12894_cov_4.083548_8_plen_61_part_00
MAADSNFSRPRLRCVRLADCCAECARSVAGRAARRAGGAMPRVDPDRADPDSAELQCTCT